MPKRHHPRRGSRAFSPRVRARRHFSRVHSWDNDLTEPQALGFAGWKAGMTHIMVRDEDPHSMTFRQDVRIPVTVVETPPMRILAVRGYEQTPYGKRTAGEVWAENAQWAPRESDKASDEVMKELEINRRLPARYHHDREAHTERLRNADLVEVRIIVCTQPKMVGTPSKKPDIMEIGISGMPTEALDWAMDRLGDTLNAADVFEEGVFTDAIGITKGKGFQGAVKRWGVKLLSHKNSKRRRQAGNLGPFSPGYVRKTIPQAGQMGYHQRTEYNKQVLRIATPEEHPITPDGGFLHYGVIKDNNHYLLIRGSLPGPAKRIIRLRRAVRRDPIADAPEIVFVSTRSKMGA